MKTMMQSASYNVLPLSENELMEISGGFIWLPFLGALVGSLGELVKDWDNFKDGLAGHPERAR
jgi:bacteriocin-like protein